MNDVFKYDLINRALLLVIILGGCAGFFHAVNTETHERHRHLEAMEAIKAGVAPVTT